MKDKEEGGKFSRERETSCWPNFLVLKMSMSSAFPRRTLEGRSLRAKPGRASESHASRTARCGRWTVWAT